MVLHNLFFAVLVLGVFLTLAPVFEGRLAAALGLFLVSIYVAAVLLLELVLMPKYIYGPLRMILAADEASRKGDPVRELIEESLIPGDEIGQIMRSRNATVALLRHRERELEQKNQQLETARRSLAEQDRLASLGLLSASVAHELNTPLSVLHGSIEKLQETIEDSAAQERLARMLRVTDRLRKISASLLDFARIPRQEMQPVPVRQVIEDAWHLISIDDKAAAVDFRNLAGPAHVVRGDADRLVQVFVNLLRNALRAVRPPGCIQVESQPDGAWIVIRVEDNGPGIPPDVLPHIFEAFVTTRLDARGTGLGLTVAEGIVQQHGGTIAASNRPGGGARLEVRLPAGISEEKP